ASESAAHTERVFDRFLRHARYEEQGNCVARRDNRAGGKKLSAQSVRQAGSSGSFGTGVVLSESSCSRQHESARVAHVFPECYPHQRCSQCRRRRSLRSQHCNGELAVARRKFIRKIVLAPLSPRFRFAAIAISPIEWNSTVRW